MIPTTAEFLKKMHLGDALEISCLLRQFSTWDLVVICSGRCRSARCWRDSLSLCVLPGKTIEHFAKAEESLPQWRPKRQSKGAQKVLVVAPPPIKFLEIGTRMGLFEIEGLIPDMKNLSSVLHPRSSSGIPDEVMRKKLGKPWAGDLLWCDPSARVSYSPNYDFHVHGPRKMFEQGPRKKYVDIVTDTLHASSSDTITWNPLAMIKTR